MATEGKNPFNKIVQSVKVDILAELTDSLRIGCATELPARLEDDVPSLTEMLNTFLTNWNCTKHLLGSRKVFFARNEHKPLVERDDLSDLSPTQKNIISAVGARLAFLYEENEEKRINEQIEKIKEMLSKNGMAIVEFEVHAKVQSLLHDSGAKVIKRSNPPATIISIPFL
jgi:hypothetical protein